MKSGGDNNGRFYREQLITIEDLEVFKVELIKEIRAIFKSNGLQPMKKWLKTSEVRKFLAVSMGTMQTLRVNGTLPYTKIGGVIYYDSADIEQMLASRKFQHPSSVKQ